MFMRLHMNENKKSRRCRGEHLEEGEVKVGIIKYILSRNAILPGPDIIKYIQKKYGLTDETNIRAHLNDLAKKNCIEKISREPGSNNNWKIEELENLLNIRKHYPEIQLNKYEKSLNIIVEKQILKGYPCIDFNHAQKLRTQLSHSIHFFDKCLQTSFTTLYDNVEDIFRLGEIADLYEISINHVKRNHTVYPLQFSISPEWAQSCYDTLRMLERRSLFS